MEEFLKKSINQHLEVVTKNFNEEFISKILAVSEIIFQAVTNDRKVMLCGNGGSAADSQHIAAEFTGRFKKERIGLNAIALTTDTSAITAIGNDYGYENVFSRQIDAISHENDILICFSTSGNSKNIIKACESATNRKCIVISLTGNDGGSVKHKSNINLNINSENTARIQECHILIGHLICEYIDSKF